MFHLFKKVTERKESEKESFNLYPFLRGDGTDDLGRRYNTIIMYNDKRLEQEHTYIQRVFPTDQKSSVINAPVITKEDAKIWGQDKKVKNNMHLMLIRLLLFYGFELVSIFNVKESDVVLLTIEDRVAWILHEEKVNKWLKESNHNLRRISRILQSLRLFQLKEDHELLSKILVALAYYKPEIKEWECWKYWSEYMELEESNTLSPDSR